MKQHMLTHKMRDMPHQMLNDKSNDSTTNPKQRSQSSNSQHSGCSMSPQPVQSQISHDEMQIDSRSSTPVDSQQRETPNTNDEENPYDQHMSDSERERESDGMSPPPVNNNTPFKIQIKADQELFSRHTPDKPDPVNFHCKLLFI